MGMFPVDEYTPQVVVQLAGVVHIVVSGSVADTVEVEAGCEACDTVAIVAIHSRDGDTDFISFPHRSERCIALIMTRAQRSET